MAELTCPKCESPMRGYERNGVTIDQCTGCRGVFLDRGELERLIDVEGSYYEKNPGGRERDEHRISHDEYKPQYGGHYKKRKKKNFLEELFD